METKTEEAIRFAFSHKIKRLSQAFLVTCYDEVISSPFLEKHPFAESFMFWDEEVCIWVDPALPEV